MSWINYHAVSERLASQAQAALREGRQQEALDLYARAADAEELAVADLDTAKVRTLGISSVSAVSLYFKAAKFERAEEVAARWLGFNVLPAFAREQLRILLQSIWSEQTRNDADAQFAQGQVLISVKGGEVVSGGAPLDLIMDKVKTVQSLFHRTAEFLGRPRTSPTRRSESGHSGQLPAVVVPDRTQQLPVCGCHSKGVPAELPHDRAVAGRRCGVFLADPSCRD